MVIKAVHYSLNSVCIENGQEVFWWATENSHLVCNDCLTIWQSVYWAISVASRTTCSIQILKVPIGITEVEAKLSYPQSFSNTYFWSHKDCAEGRCKQGRMALSSIDEVFVMTMPDEQITFSQQFLGFLDCYHWTSLFLFVLNPKTSLDVWRITVFSCTNNDSEEQSVRQCRTLSKYCRPAWKSFFTSSDCNLPSINFFIDGPAHHGLTLKCSLRLQQMKQRSVWHSTQDIILACKTSFRSFWHTKTLSIRCQCLDWECI